MNGSRLLLAATALGAVAAFFVVGVTGDRVEATTPARPVVVATEAIAGGSRALASAFTVSNWADPSAPPPADSLAAIKLVEGRIAVAPINPGRVIRDSDFYPAGSTHPGLLPMTAGMRAYTATINDLDRVAGFAGPGSTVDVMLSATRNVPQPFSRMVLTGVRVLAVKSDPPPADPKTAPIKGPVPSMVTFELTQEQAEQLDLARNIGDLTVVIRGEGIADTATPESRGARIVDLMGAPPKVEQAPPPEPIVVIRQVRKTETPIEEIRGGRIIQNRSLD
jgi:pilus assembly protein CpaB